MIHISSKIKIKFLLKLTKMLLLLHPFHVWLCAIHNIRVPMIQKSHLIYVLHLRLISRKFVECIQRIYFLIFFISFFMIFFLCVYIFPLTFTHNQHDNIPSFIRSNCSCVFLFLCEVISGSFCNVSFTFINICFYLSRFIPCGFQDHRSHNVNEK